MTLEEGRTLVGQLVMTTCTGNKLLPSGRWHGPYKLLQVTKAGRCILRGEKISARLYHKSYYTNKMKTLCKYLGGSHLYGMNTPASDVDERGVFMNDDPLYVYGFHRLDNQVKQTAEADVVMHELTQFIKLATKSNTQTLECLFAPLDAFTYLHPEFSDRVLLQRYRFLNTDQLFKSLEGYLYNEMRLALGERTGLLGSKRKNSLEKHGFSPKNFSHLFRLAECGRQFFLTGVYPVRLKDFNPSLHDLCMSVKVSPEKWTADELQTRATELRDEMRVAYESMKESDKFLPDLEYAGKVLQYFYSNTR